MDGALGWCDSGLVGGLILQRTICVYGNVMARIGPRGCRVVGFRDNDVLWGGCHATGGRLREQPVMSNLLAQSIEK